MAVIASWKRNSLFPAVGATLLQSDGSGIDLSTANSVNFVMQDSRRHVPPKVDAEAQITDATAGKVRYDWSDGDTDTVGWFFIEWRIVWGSGKEEIVPSFEYNIIRIVSELA